MEIFTVQMCGDVFIFQTASLAYLVSFLLGSETHDSTEQLCSRGFSPPLDNYTTSSYFCWWSSHGFSLSLVLCVLEWRFLSRGYIILSFISLFPGVMQDPVSVFEQLLALIIYSASYFCYLSTCTYTHTHAHLMHTPKPTGLCAFRHTVSCQGEMRRVNIILRVCMCEEGVIWGTKNRCARCNWFWCNVEGVCVCVYVCMSVCVCVCVYLCVLCAPGSRRPGQRTV